MIGIVLLAILAILLFGVGFTVHLLWWVAVILALVWLIGFFVRPGAGRWYYW
ncbi:MAG: hydrophobic protein [Acidimicrobiales bacterium]